MFPTWKMLDVSDTGMLDVPDWGMTDIRYQMGMMDVLDMGMTDVSDTGDGRPRHGEGGRP